MDVEENELYVLIGGKYTILKHKPHILFEANTYNPELWNFFTNELRYSITGVSGVDNMFLASPLKPLVSCF
jgi:hypothetical protein